jgi:hypothetical protein
MALSDSAPTSAPSKQIPFWDFMDGMKLFPRGQFTWSVLFFQPNFYSLDQFYFFVGTVFISLFFGTPLNQSFFGEAPTYTQPTYRPSSYQAPSLPHVAHPSPPHHLRSLPTPTSALLAITIAKQVRRKTTNA